MAKLMLVEDDNNLREIYEARLQAEGYNLVTARDGEEALVVAKAELPDLVISDVMMPKISGFEMLDILRNTEGLKDVKVIMLTALGQADDQQRGDKLGADRYLVKSQVTLEDIVREAHELLGDSTVEATPATMPATSSEPTTATPSEEPAASTPEPAAVAPAPEPTQALPTTAPEPPVTAEPAAASTTTASNDSSATTTDTSAIVIDEPTAAPATAQSTAQEEASIEAKIENFVAGASSEATPPSDAPQPAPETPSVEPSSEPAPVVEAANPATESSMEVQPSNQEDMPSGSVVVVKSDDETDQEPKEDLNGNVKIAGKKVIQPVDVSPTRDLDALLAAEEAKEAGQQSPLATATVVDNETGVTQAPIDPAQAQAQPTDFVAEQSKKEDEEPPKPVDPGSIAL